MLNIKITKGEQKIEGTVNGWDVKASKKSVKAEALIEFDHMILSEKRYLQVNMDAFLQGKSVNELLGAKVTTSKAQMDECVDLFLKGDFVGSIFIQ